MENCCTRGGDSVKSVFFFKKRFEYFFTIIACYYFNPNISYSTWCGIIVNDDVYWVYLLITAYFTADGFRIF